MLLPSITNVCQSSQKKFYSIDPSASGVSDHHCVWFDKCGPDPDFKDNVHPLNCVYEGPAGEWPLAAVITLKVLLNFLVF